MKTTCKSLFPFTLLLIVDLVSRGLLWSAGKLADDGKAAAGYGK